MKKNIYKPNYDRSILSISSSIMKYYGMNLNYKSLGELDNLLEKKYKNVIFLILDCLGTKVLTDNLKDDSLLRTNLITNVTSVFPPTTAAATTAFHSGMSPLENGWIGWMPYFKEYNKIIELFTGNDFYTREKVIEPFDDKLLKYKTIYEKISETNKNVKYHKIFPANIDANGASSFKELCDKIKKCCNNGTTNLISAYWNEPDHTIHNNGVNNEAVKNVLNDIEINVKELTTNLKDSIVIISADHGAVDVEEVYINEIADINDCLAMPPSIESRFVTFFIKKGMKNKFKKAIKEHFEDGYILYNKEQFMQENLLGRGLSNQRINSYFGDYILILYSNLNIRYSISSQKDKIHLADHGGITKEEMMVPLIVLDCK